MKEDDVDKDKIFVSVKMRYKGEHWELGSYVDPSNLTVDEAERYVERAITRSSIGIGGALRREDIAANFVKD